MTVSELYAFLNERIPASLSCEWDNDGMMCCADPTKEVRRVLVALDITADVVEEAVANGYNAVISHHPLIFRPLRRVCACDPVAKKVIRLLSCGVSAMSFHTRLDAVAGGVNDVLAAKLGLTDLTPFGNEGEAIGRIGTLPVPTSATAFAETVKAVLGAECVLLSDAGREVKRVAILGGSGSDDVSAAREAGADTYLSGELGHHHLTDCPEFGMNLIAAGHFYTENPVCDAIRGMLLDIDPTLTVDVADSNRIRTV